MEICIFGVEEIAANSQRGEALASLVRDFSSFCFVFFELSRAIEARKGAENDE